MKTKTFAYDIETLPNFLSFVFQNVDDEEDACDYLVFDGKDERPEMCAWLQETRPELVGFNNFYFDDLILGATLLYPNKLPRVVYELAQKIISRQYSEIRLYNRLRGARDKLQATDLLQLLGGRTVSLKEIAGKLGLPVIDMPIAHDQVVEPDQVPSLLEYNRSDVAVTVALYHELEPVIESRRAIGREFGVHALSSTDSTLANLILEELFGKPESHSTPQSFVDLSDIISQKIHFETEGFGSLLEELRGTRLELVKKFRFNKKISYGGNRYRLGVGGLHSEDKPGIYRSSEEFRVRDADVISYYPSIMISCEIAPDHLGGRFLKFYRGMVDRRLEAKSAGDTVKADGLKITINSVFGKLNWEHFWLYDPRAFLAVTINGQLFLLDLIEKLTLAGIEIISANTDGITALIKPDQEELYATACRAWETRVGFALEYTDYALYVRRDVNNYLALTDTGRLKTKGIFSEDKRLREAYRAPIKARALSEYFIDGRAPEETLSAEDSIMPYCYVFKPGSKFEMVFYPPEGEEIPTPRVNRYYVSTSGGSLIKECKAEDKRIRATVKPVSLVNGELSQGIPEDLDTDYYLEEIKKEIAKIEKGKITLPLGAGSLGLFGDIDPEELDKALEKVPAEDSSEELDSYPSLSSSYSLAEIAEYMGAIEEGDSYRAPCPVHESKSSRSLTLSEGDNGEIRLHCFAGTCKPAEILAEIESRIDGGEPFRKPDQEHLGDLVATYEYTDEFGRANTSPHLCRNLW